MADTKAKEKAKKQIPLRVSASLYADLAQWAEEDFRSINGQIESDGMCAAPQEDRKR